MDYLYAPRPLREATYAISGEAEDNTLYGTPDLVRDAESGVEVSSVNHSPILVGHMMDIQYMDLMHLLTMMVVDLLLR